VTSELDSESLSTLRKINFKRDSCKVDEVAAPVITSCKISKRQFQKNSKFSKKFKKIRTVSNSFKKIQKISESQFTTKCRSPSCSWWRSRPGTQCENGKISSRRRPPFQAAVTMKPAGKGGRVYGMCQVHAYVDITGTQCTFFDRLSTFAGH
jgi:hypothetical protein